MVMSIGLALIFLNLNRCMNNPTPKQIKQARTNAGLTQTASAAVIYKTCRTWQQYEAGDRKMDAALFELFQIKTGLSCLTETAA